MSPGSPSKWNATRSPRPSSTCRSRALNDALEARFQFLRKGYFYQDTNSTKDKLVFNRTVTLKDTWAKEQKK